MTLPKQHISEGSIRTVIPMSYETTPDTCVFNCMSCTSRDQCNKWKDEDNTPLILEFHYDNIEEIAQEETNHGLDPVPTWLRNAWDRAMDLADRGLY